MTRKLKRTVWRTGHVTWVITDSPERGRTFGLYACGDDEFGENKLPERKALLFSGHISEGMTTELHRLAAHVSTLEAKVAASRKKDESQ